MSSRDPDPNESREDVFKKWAQKHSVVWADWRQTHQVRHQNELVFTNRPRPPLDAQRPWHVYTQRQEGRISQERCMVPFLNPPTSSILADCPDKTNLFRCQVRVSDGGIEEKEH